MPIRLKWMCQRISARLAAARKGKASGRLGSCRLHLSANR